MVLLVVVVLGVGVIGLYALLLTWQLRHGQVYGAWRQRVDAIRWANYTGRWMLYRHHHVPDPGAQRFLQDPARYRRAGDTWLLEPGPVPVPEGFARPKNEFAWSFRQPPFATAPPYVATVLWEKGRARDRLLKVVFQPFPLGAFLLEIGPEMQGRFLFRLPPFGRIVLGRSLPENNLQLGTAWQGEVWSINGVRLPARMATGSVHPIPAWPAWTVWNDWDIWKQATQRRGVCGPKRAIGLYLGPEGTAAYQAQIRNLFEVDGQYVIDLNDWDVCRGPGPVYRGVPLFPFDGPPGGAWPGWNGIIYIEGRFRLQGTLRVGCMRRPGIEWNPGHLWIVHPGDDPGTLVLPLQTAPPMSRPRAPVLTVLHRGATLLQGNGEPQSTFAWMGRYFLDGPVRWQVTPANAQVHIVGGLHINGAIASADRVHISIRHPGMPPVRPPAGCSADHWIWSLQTVEY